MKNYIKKIGISVAIILSTASVYAQSFQLVNNINQSPDDAGLFLNCSFREMNGKLYYLFTDQSIGKTGLFTSDGTNAGTYRVSPSNLDISGNIIQGGNKLYFFASDGINGKEPWVSDGTLAGTQMLKNIHSTTDPFNFETNSAVFLSADSTKAFFAANDGTTGNELWVTDGTTAGTVFVMDIFDGTNDSQIKVAPSAMGSNMKDGKLYFFAVNGTGGFTVNGMEPWVSDGTSAGTFMLKDIQAGYNPSSQSSNTKHFVEFNNKMYFFAAGSAGNGLWETDGTTTGTQLVYGTTIYRIDEFLVHNNLLYFTHSNGPTLYTSDGTTAGTNLLTTIPNAQLNNIGTCQMVVANNTLYFRVVSNSLGSELFMLDGSNQIVNVKDIQTGITNGIVGNIYQERKVLQVYDNKVWFLGSDGSFSGALQVWQSDGTNMGTIALSPLNNDGGWAGGNGNGYNIFATTFGVFMIYNNPTTGAELYFYNGLPTSLQDGAEVLSNVVLYPNPATDLVNITSDDVIISKRIYNAFGQMIQEIQGESTKIDVSEYKVGLYFVVITTKNEKSKKSKFIKK
ncbi:MAG: T9SS type A sorting domain-containing protein [Bacteroidetes bacterium]|nr:T9SS type A sorting domain-containing protein [Bacteroidota bacterium]